MREEVRMIQEVRFITALALVTVASVVAMAAMPIPDYTGMSAAEAIQAAEASGLAMYEVRYSTAPATTSLLAVVGQVPAPGAEVNAGDYVTLALHQATSLTGTGSVRIVGLASTQEYSFDLLTWYAANAGTIVIPAGQYALFVREGGVLSHLDGNITTVRWDLPILVVLDGQITVYNIPVAEGDCAIEISAGTGGTVNGDSALQIQLYAGSVGTSALRATAQTGYRFARWELVSYTASGIVTLGEVLLPPVGAPVGLVLQQTSQVRIHAPAGCTAVALRAVFSPYTGEMQ